MTPVRLEPATPRSRVKHSTTEPLGSRNQVDMRIIVINVYNCWGNRNEFIDQKKELSPDYYDSHMYRYFHMTVFVCLYWP